MIKSLLTLKKIGWLTPAHQILLLLIALFASAYFYRDTGNLRLVFVPLYEEVLFRGILLGSLLTLIKPNWALWLSSLLFGIWHLKNLSFMPTEDVFYQVAYTALLVGPFLAWLTLKTKSIWLGVLFHTINNILLSPLSWWIMLEYLH